MTDTDHIRTDHCDCERCTGQYRLSTRDPGRLAFIAWVLLFDAFVLCAAYWTMRHH